MGAMRAGKRASAQQDPRRPPGDPEISPPTRYVEINSARRTTPDYLPVWHEHRLARLARRVTRGHHGPPGTAIPSLTAEARRKTRGAMDFEMGPPLPAVITLAEPLLRPLSNVFLLKC